MEILPDSSITLYKNVPFQPDYSDVRYFQSPTERYEYFNKLSSKYVEKTTYSREQRAIKLPIGINDTYAYNYISFTNKSSDGYDIGEQEFTFYAWITDYTYINKAVTQLSFKVDAFTTYFPYCTIKHSTYHVRKHLHKDSNGLYTMCTQPENMEIGNAYRSIYKRQLFPDMEYVTLLCSSAYIASGKFGTISNPTMTTAKGCVVGGIPSCLDFYIIEDISTFMDEMSAYPWITRCFQNLTYIPKEMTDLITEEQGCNVSGDVTRIIKANGIWKRSSTSVDLQQYYPKSDNALMRFYPYSILQMTDYSGNEIILKPENFIESNDLLKTFDTTKILKNLQFDYYGYISATPRFVVLPFGYNSDATEKNNYPDSVGLSVKGDFLDNALIQANYPQLPILTDEYLLYMASNAHQKQYQQDYITYKQNYNTMQNNISGATGLLGAVGSLASGNVGGGLSSLASTATNYLMNDYSNQMETAFARQAIQAQQQDMKLSAPSVQSQVDGIAFNIANDIKSPTVNLKCIKPEYWNRIDTYMTQFGCTTLTFETVTFKDRYSYNFLQLQNPFVEVKDDYTNYLSLGLQVKIALQQIFIDGVRLWHTDDMCNFDLPNGEV